MSRLTTPLPAANMVTFFHDTEQNFGIKVNPEECRQVVAGFLQIEREYGISSTYNVVGKIYQEQPELIDQIIRAGHEVAFHSYSHTYEPENYPAEVARCRELSSSVKGYRSPRSQYSDLTLNALWENQFLWSAENDSAKEPYFIHKGLVRLPIAADDWPVHIHQITLEQWIGSFADLIKRGGYFAFGNHDCVVSVKPDERLKAFEKMIQIAIQNKALIVNFSEAANLFRRAALSKYYSDTAKNWNETNEGLYRTKKFKELIRFEAQKLDKPVVADLGSAGGLLTSQLTDIAETIYCVDNAPGMIESVNKSPVIKAKIGDVTDSHLPDNEIDYVIATRVVEYLYWPDHLADEIKRIGKLGATYFVTFPATRKTPPDGGKYPPDRIRRYFAAEEVLEWARRIGPGRLIGIPQSEEAEAEYQANPSMHVVHNWIYIGAIDNKIRSSASVRMKSIPLAEFAFNFRNHQMDAYLKSMGRYVPRPVREIIKMLPYFSKL